MMAVNRLGQALIEGESRCSYGAENERSKLEGWLRSIAERYWRKLAQAPFQ